MHSAPAHAVIVSRKMKPCLFIFLWCLKTLPQPVAEQEALIPLLMIRQMQHEDGNHKAKSERVVGFMCVIIGWSMTVNVIFM